MINVNAEGGLNGRHPLNSICELGKQKSMPPSKTPRSKLSIITRAHTRNPSPEGEEERTRGAMDTCHAALIFTRTRVNCESRNTAIVEEERRERVDDYDDGGRAQRDTGMDGWMDGEGGWS